MSLAALICCALAQEPKLDLHGDPLPPGALARLGTLRFRGPHYLHPLAVTPDGKVIAAFEHGGGVLTWDGATGKVLRRFSPQRGPDAPSSGRSPGIALTPDGRLVAAGSYDDRVRVWSIETGKEVFSLGGFGARVCIVALSPDGRRLAAAAPDSAMRLCRIDEGKADPLPEPPPKVVDAAFAPDGRLLAVGTQGEIRLLDPAGGSLRRRLAIRGNPSPLVFSNDGRRLACYLGKTSLQVFNVEAGEPVTQVAAMEFRQPFLAFSADDAKLLFTDGQRLQALDLAAREQEAKMDLQPWSGPFAFAPKTGLLLESYIHRLRLWKDGREIEGPAGHAESVSGAAFSPDGRRVASATGDALLLWNADDGRLVRKLPLPSGGLRAVSWSPDGRRVVAGGVNFGLTAWDVETGTPAWTQSRGPGGSLCALAYSPDGAQLAIGDAGGRLRVYDAAGGAQLFHPAGHAGSVNGMAYLDVRTIVSVGADHVARLWSAQTGKLLGSLEGHTSDLSDLDVSRDGSRIVTASTHMNAKRDGTIRVWEAFSGALLRTIDPAPSYPAGAIALARDGRTLAAFSLFQAKIPLWDIRTGLLAGSLPGHENGGEALAFSPDGLRLASGGMDTTVLVWKLPTLPAATPKPPADLEKAWDLLLTVPPGGIDDLLDALVAAGPKAVDALLPRCRPVPLPAAEKPRLEAWMKALESEDAATRAEAVENLVGSPYPVELLLTGEATFLEARELQASIRARRNPEPPRMMGEALRRRRAIQVLERLEAKAALKELAEFWPAAADALQRLR